MSNKIYTILGPTSSGKTSLAIELCKKYNGEIVSADSRQIYKGMDIGTGKVPLKTETFYAAHAQYWILAGVTIWGYDLVSPNEDFSSFDFAKFALEKLRRIKKTKFLVGGTGFYIDMVTGRVKPSNIARDPKLRDQLSTLSLSDLNLKYDALSTAEVDRHNPVRLIRAIEKLVGVPNEISTPLNYLKNTDFIHIGLTAPRTYFYERVDKWAEVVWANGLLKETTRLLTSSSQKLNGLVYKQAKAYLNQELSRDEAIQKTKYALHAYIRRQQTYFKRIPNINWVDVSEDNYKQNIYNIING